VDAITQTLPKILPFILVLQKNFLGILHFLKSVLNKRYKFLAFIYL